MFIDNVIKQFWKLCFISVFVISCSGNKADLIVMSYNVTIVDSTTNGWLNQKNIIINNLNQYSPDVFGLQSVDRAKAYDLALDLNSYQSVMNEDNLSFINLNPLYFKSNRYELIAKARYSIMRSSDNDTVSESIGYVTWIKLKELKSGYIFFVFNSNFIEGYSLNHNDLDDFANKINDIAGHAPAVILGDFGKLKDQRILFQEFNKQFQDSVLMRDSSNVIGLNVVSNGYFETHKNILLTNQGLGPAVGFFDFNFDNIGK